MREIVLSWIGTDEKGCGKIFMEDEFSEAWEVNND